MMWSAPDQEIRSVVMSEAFVAELEPEEESLNPEEELVMVSGSPVAVVRLPTASSDE